MVDAARRLMQAAEQRNGCQLSYGRREVCGDDTVDDHRAGLLAQHGTADAAGGQRREGKGARRSRHEAEAYTMCSGAIGQAPMVEVPARELVWIAERDQQNSQRVGHSGCSSTLVGI